MACPEVSFIAPKKGAWQQDTQKSNDIDDEHSPKARKFFYELIDNYELEMAGLKKRIDVLEAAITNRHHLYLPRNLKSKSLRKVVGMCQLRS